MGLFPVPARAPSGPRRPRLGLAPSFMDPPVGLWEPCPRAGWEEAEERGVDSLPWSSSPWPPISRLLRVLFLFFF